MTAASPVATREQALPRVLARFVDVVSAGAGLVLLVPVFTAIALAILCDDGAPVFFRQVRVGKKGRLFRIWKFRTMGAGTCGGVITAAGDGRVTRAGAVLRRLKLDELPQLLNVLAGEMSLVGPRPEVPEYVEAASAVWRNVLDVRPGITDLASLLYRDEERILGESSDPDALYRERILPAKLMLNLEYLRSRSFRRDLRLILLTLRYSLCPRGFDPNRILKSFVTGAAHE